MGWYDDEWSNIRCKLCGARTPALWREDKYWPICEECNNEFVWGVDSEVGVSCEMDMSETLLWAIETRWR